MRFTLTDYEGGEKIRSSTGAPCRRVQRRARDRRRRHMQRGVPGEARLARDEVSVQVQGARRTRAPTRPRRRPGGRGASGAGRSPSHCCWDLRHGRGVLGGRRRDLPLRQAPAAPLYAVVGAVLVADVVFLIAIVRHDFSFGTVADTTSRELPHRLPAVVVLGAPAGLAAAVADGAGAPPARCWSSDQPRIATAS